MNQVNLKINPSHSLRYTITSLESKVVILYTCNDADKYSYQLSKQGGHSSMPHEAIQGVKLVK